MGEYIKLQTPLTKEKLAPLCAGDRILISGVIYTGRDAAHKRLIELLDCGKALPVDLRNQAIYFVGPTPTPPGRICGSAGPTSSYRMDKFSPRLIREAGLTAMIGKGRRNSDVVNAMIDCGSVYFTAVGGAAALIAKSITKVEVIAYEDLGPEAIRYMEVEDFPAIVTIDAKGNNLYEIGRQQYALPLDDSYKE